MNPSSLKAVITASLGLNHFRNRYAGFDGKCLQKLRCWPDGALVVPSFAGGLAHSRRIDAPVLRALVDNPTLDRMGYQVEVLLQGRISGDLRP